MNNLHGGAMLLLSPFNFFFFIAMKGFAGNSFYPETTVVKCGCHTPWLVVGGLLL